MCTIALPSRHFEMLSTKLLEFEQSDELIDFTLCVFRFFYILCICTKSNKKKFYDFKLSGWVLVENLTHLVLLKVNIKNSQYL